MCRVLLCVCVLGTDADPQSAVGYYLCIRDHVHAFQYFTYVSIAAALLS
jgi:hypothetical protein